MHENSREELVQLYRYPVIIHCDEITRREIEHLLIGNALKQPPGRHGMGWVSVCVCVCVCDL